MFGRKITQEVDANAAAKSYVSGLEAKLVAGGGVLGGNPALTTQIVLEAANGTMQIQSAGDGNVVTIYASGADRNTGTIKTQVFMAKGERHMETGIVGGAVVTSTAGVCGVSDFANNNPVTLAPEAFGDRIFFFNIFRNAATGNNVFVACGGVASVVTLKSGDGLTTYANVALEPYELVVLTTGTVNGEYQLRATEPVFLGVRGNSLGDARLVPPLATELIGQNANCRVSALYDNTTVWWHTQDGTIGRFNLSPGSPVSIYTGTPNNLGDVFFIGSDATPATAGTFTITINGETTAAIAYNAGAKELLAGLDTLTSYSAADFEIEQLLGSKLSDASSQMVVFCGGALSRIAGSPTITTTGLTGNPHTLTLFQSGTAAANAGNDFGYRPQGCTYLRANKPISAFSGADGSGGDATYYMPRQFLSQTIPFPLSTLSVGNSQVTGIAVQSFYKGTAKIYRDDGSLVYQFTFDRDSGLAIDSKFKQRFPAAGLVSQAGDAFATVTFTEDFLGGYIESDVPINIIFNSNDNDVLQAGGIPTAGDEIVFFGVTPDIIRASIRAPVTGDGRSRILNIAADGTQTWELV